MPELPEVEHAARVLHDCDPRMFGRIGVHAGAFCGRCQKAG
jgi:hypothetical protein